MPRKKAEEPVIYKYSYHANKKDLEKRDLCYMELLEGIAENLEKNTQATTDLMDWLQTFCRILQRQ